jgi:hypothetical protein
MSILLAEIKIDKIWFNPFYTEQQIYVFRKLKMFIS